MRRSRAFHHISAKHLQEYLDEFAFRRSHRHEKPVMMGMILAHCATWNVLTGSTYFFLLFAALVQ